MQILGSHISFWLKRAGVIAITLGGLAYLLLALFSKNWASPVEWALVVSAFAGPQASIYYRVATWAPSASLQTLAAWLGSTLWAGGFFLIASYTSGSFVAFNTSLGFRALALAGLGAFISLMCLMPLKWLRASVGPQIAP